jgi:NIPSNAP
MIDPASETQFQLRDYRIKSGEMDDWVGEWLAHVRPLRERFGFRILGAWTIEQDDRFIWVLARADFDTADARYYDSIERRSIQPDPARHIAATTHLFIKPV